LLHENFLPRLFILSAAFLLGAASVTLNAQDLGAVKARMSQRLSKLDEFKAKGVLARTTTASSSCAGATRRPVM